MSGRFPYVASAGPILKTVDRFRHNFPQEVTASILQKLGIAPKNESYVINVLRFLDLISEDGSKVEEKARVFLNSKEDQFQAESGQIVQEAYKELFVLYKDGAWTVEKEDLIQFFRMTDKSSKIVGERQANTFICLAGLAGRRTLPSTKEARARKSEKRISKSTQAESRTTKSQKQKSSAEKKQNGQNLGLTVRIEINLPADGSQEVYDMIFRSIRENLINES